MGQALDVVVKSRRGVDLLDDALTQSRAVSKNQEGDLAAGAAVVDPAAEAHGLTHMIAQMTDCGDGFHVGQFTGVTSLMQRCE